MRRTYRRAVAAALGCLLVLSQPVAGAAQIGEETAFSAGWPGVSLLEEEPQALAIDSQAPITGASTLAEDPLDPNKDSGIVSDDDRSTLDKTHIITDQIEISEEEAEILPVNQDQLPKEIGDGTEEKEMILSEEDWSDGGLKAGQEEGSLEEALFEDGAIEPALQAFPAAASSRVGSTQEGWSISLSYSDSGSTDPSAFLDESQPIVWNAVSSNEKRRITIQIHYKNEQVEETLQPGEAQFTIPDLASLFAGDRDGREMDRTIGADPEGSDQKLNFWSYKRYWDSLEGCYYYRFRNQTAIEEKTNFEGNIQLSWELAAPWGSKYRHLELAASLLGTLYTKPIQMDFTSTEKTYSLTKVPSKVASLEGFPEGDYIWVKYRVYGESISNSQGVRFLDPETAFVEDVIPADCLCLDKDLTLCPTGDICRFPVTALENSHYSSRLESVFYVGYPTAAYEAQTLTNTASLYGGYCTLDACTLPAGEISLVESASCQVAVADFKFVYDGNLYGLVKSAKAYAANSALIRDRHETIPFYLYSSCVYTGKPMTVRIGDDLAGILYSDGQFHILEDGSRWFAQVTVPKFKNANGGYFVNDAYRYDLYVRYQGKADYELYTSYTANQEKTITFPEGSQVAGWYLDLVGLEESLSMTGDNKDRLTTYLCVQDPSVTDTGTVYNFARLQVFLDGRPQIYPGLENYEGEYTRRYIASYDLENYGNYCYRSCASVDFRAENNGVFCEKKMDALARDGERERFLSTVHLTMGYAQYDINSFNTRFQGFSVYDLLPLGMDVREDEISTDLAGSAYQRIRRQDGSAFTKQEYLAFLKNRTTYQIVRNWRGTGRTWISVQVNLADAPLDISHLSETLPQYTVYFNRKAEDYRIHIPVSVSFDSYLAYGDTYWNIAYACEYGVDNFAAADSHSFNQLYYVKDDGSYLSLFGEEVFDIDDDGVTEEIFYFAQARRVITETVSTHQDVTVFVSSKQDYLTTGHTMTEPLEEYTYRLRVRSGDNRITNLVIYDNLETSWGDNPYWQGNLEGIDTSFAVGQGYQVVVYYSESESPGSLEEDSSWIPYQDTTDKSRIRSLAFAYRTPEGEAALLPAQAVSYVEIRMKAPALASSGANAYNSFHTSWNALDQMGVAVPDVTGIHSNTVEVSLQEPYQKASLTLTKEIDAEDVVWAHGNPVFFFQIQGRDADGNDCSYTCPVIFTASQVPAAGKATCSVTLELEPGIYSVQELGVMRYSLEEIRQVTAGTVEGEKVLFSLGTKGSWSYPEHGAALFYNRKVTDEGLSDIALVRNVVGGA